jgi:uncharacterized membrane protein YheB (UPF0754 family)
MSTMTNQEIDTALILENELQRRVTGVVAHVVHKTVEKAIREQFVKHKEAMLLEISMSVGKMLRVIEEEGRNPLWQSTPEEFAHLKKDQDHALREQT